MGALRPGCRLSREDLRKLNAISARMSEKHKFGEDEMQDYDEQGERVRAALPTNPSSLLSISHFNC